MKSLTIKLSLIAICLSTLSFAANSSKYKKYDDLFEAINKRRHGLSIEAIERTKNPFIIESKQIIIADDNSSTSSGPVYKLKAIMNNSANINGQWHKLNEDNEEFKLIKINNNSVVIDIEGASLELKLNKGNRNVTITTK